MRVVVVEDDRNNALLLEKVLRRLGGYEVTATDDPQELLRLVYGGDVTAVVMDVSLRDSVLDGVPMDGVALTRALRADPRAAGVAVVLATAHAMRGDAERLLRASGADGYVAKPFTDLQAVVDAVRRGIEARSHAGREV